MVMRPDDAQEDAQPAQERLELAELEQLAAQLLRRNARTPARAHVDQKQQPERNAE